MPKRYEKPSLSGYNKEVEKMVSQKSGPVLVDKEPQLIAVITTKGDPNEVMKRPCLHYKALSMD